GHPVASLTRAVRGDERRDTVFERVGGRVVEVAVVINQEIGAVGIDHGEVELAVVVEVADGGRQRADASGDELDIGAGGGGEDEVGGEWRGFSPARLQDLGDDIVAEPEAANAVVAGGVGDGGGDAADDLD